MIYSIADLHLSETADKPMDVFGSKWCGYTEKILNNWQKTVTDNDTVIIPGDISWGMGIGNSTADLLFVEKLPGKKIIGKGNHDYWWQTMKKLDEFKEKNGIKTIEFLHNNAFLAENIIVCGSRGWVADEVATTDDRVIITREAGRLRLSLENAVKINAENPDAEIVSFMHYPPAYNGTKSREIIAVLEEFGVKKCYYGHIHGAPETNHEAYAGNVRIFCVSADYLNFTPVKIFKSNT